MNQVAQVRFRTLFGASTLGGLASLGIWHLSQLAWERFGWPTIAAVGGAILLLNVLGVIVYWLRGRKGLDQWPEPHGRYYSEWLSSLSEVGDYYEWLSQKMGGREPWATWARLERRNNRATSASGSGHEA